MAGITKIQESLQESLPDFEQSMDIPAPPTNLIITKGVWSHHLTWDNPTDEIVSHIEIWVATNSQDRSNAVIRGIVTVTENLRGKKGSFDFSGLDVTDDLVYWIRSISYAGNHSTWEPPDDQGGYVVPGNETLDETINDIMDALKGSITEDQLYIDLSSRIDRIEDMDFTISNPATGLIDRMSTVELAIDSMPLFDTNVPYFVDDMVSYSNKIYACIKNTTTPSPLPTDTEYWEIIGSTASLTGAMAANALAINNLDSRVVVVEGEVTSITSDLTLLTSEVGNNRSAIQTEQEARTSQDSALAQSINTVQSKLGDNFSSVETVSKAIDGIEASHTIKVQADSNGKLVMAGIGLIADSVTQQSEIMMMANQFQIVIPGATPGSVPTQPFIIKNIDGVDTVGISGNLVIDGKILGKHIEANSITSAHLSSTEIFTMKLEVGPGSTGFSNFKDGCPADADSTQTALDMGADISHAKTNGRTLIQGGYINAEVIDANMLLVGPKGDTGPQGPQGLQGPPGVDGRAYWGHRNDTTLIDGGNIYAGSLFVKTADIVNASVSTIKIAGQAVTIPVSAYTQAALAVSGIGFHPVQSATIISTGAPILIIFSMRAYGVTTNTWNFDLEKNGTRLYIGPIFEQHALSNPVITVSITDTPGAGEVVYKVRVYNLSAADGAASISHRTITLLEVKR